MKYMGSKGRIAKHILPIILKDRKPGQWYVEPFVGGANMIDKVDGNRIGSDNNEYLISYLKGVSEGRLPPEEVLEHLYNYIKMNKDINPFLTGYIGFSFSFGAKWFGGYRRDIKGTKEDDFLKKNNEKKQSISSYNSYVKQSEKLKDVLFFHKSYDEYTFTEPVIIYCDPPYEGTTKYKDDFDHVKFWDWCRKMTKEGHQVFISEYNAPEDFECIWSIPKISGIRRENKEIKTEKLFIYASNK